jgi:hypothetical protein
MTVRSEIDKLNSSQTQALRNEGLNYRVRDAHVETFTYLSGSQNITTAAVTLTYDHKREYRLLGPRGKVVEADTHIFTKDPK